MSDSTAQIPGLSEVEAKHLLEEYGPNRIEEAKQRPWFLFLAKFWAPVPWMLELVIAIQASMGKTVEAGVMLALLLINACLSFVQESRANAALALLKRQLSVQARVLRDGRWGVVAAETLVPGDVIRLRMGDMVPADLTLHSGSVLVDQSSLTGESIPAELAEGATAFAGSLVRRGEATAKVGATGARTRFGKAAELVRDARAVGHMQNTILRIVRALVGIDLVLIVVMSAFALSAHVPLLDLVSFALILLVAAVPVALPATFTLATTLGARELAGSGVLVTRLSAIEDAASMDVLATDKTGTITENHLTLSTVQAYSPCDDKEVLRLAALASDEASQDPIDLAILIAARERSVPLMAERLRFKPFDPTTKRTEAVLQDGGSELRIVKGAPRTVAALVQSAPSYQEDLERLAAANGRVIAIAAGRAESLSLAGLIALADPPRRESASVIGKLRALGVRVVMVTGDGLNTARSIASVVGIGSRGCRREVVADAGTKALEEYDVFAGVFPEDKFAIVRGFQSSGHIAGMTGDGVNDAPALKQAEVGVAVANATDIAKAAASLVLTEPGLGNLVSAVECSRRIHQRMRTYALNKIVKTLELSVFLSVGLITSGLFVVTPMLVVLLLFTNDFVTMSIATDRVETPQSPQHWHVSSLVRLAGSIAAAVLTLSFSVLYAGRHVLHLDVRELQTLLFVMLVWTGLGVVYVVREQRHFWSSRPSRWLLISTLVDVVVVAFLAVRGILMAPIPPTLLASLAGTVVAFLLLLDLLKGWVSTLLHPGVANNRKGLQAS